MTVRPGIGKLAVDLGSALLACLLAVTLGSPCGLRARDGTLLDRTTVDFTDEQRAQLQQGGVALEPIEISSITCLSDGLKVKGYLVVPRRGTAHPAVIYNRGGNREFGAFWR